MLVRDIRIVQYDYNIILLVVGKNLGTVHCQAILDEAVNQRAILNEMSTLFRDDLTQLFI